MQPLKHIKVVGLDPSLRNWGIAVGSMVPGHLDSLYIHSVQTIQPEISKNKQVRQNSLDLDSAKQLCAAAIKATEGAQAIFVEVPVGSQSARAMASYGVCVGVLGSLRAIGIPLFEVSPQEVKLAGPGKATATKLQMIEWAMNKHPEADWPTYVQKGKILVNTSKAEHQADATATIYAGMVSDPFQQLLSLLRQPP